MVREGKSVTAKEDPTLTGGDLNELNGNLWSGDVICFNSSSQCNADYIQFQPGCHPSKVNVVSDKAYISTTCDSAVQYGQIRELFNDTSAKIQFSDSSIFPYASFIKTMAYDIDEDGGASQLIMAGLFEESGSQKLMLFGKHGTSNSIYQEVTTFTEVKKIIITKRQPDDDSDDGQAIAITDNGIAFIEYDLIDAVSSFGDGQMIKITGEINVSHGISAQISPDKAYVFVLSNANDSTTTSDDYITVIDVGAQQKDEIAFTQYYKAGDEGVIYLSQQLSGKVPTDINPRAIQYVVDPDANPHLYVSLDALRGAVIIDL